MIGRTEARQSSHYNDVSVSPFVWSAEVHAAIPVGKSWIYGEIPPGSIVFGGFVQVTEEVVGDLAFTIGPSQRIFDTTGSLPPGWYSLLWSSFSDPSQNFLIGTAEGESRMRVDNTGPGPIIAGKFCIYVFYVNDELGPLSDINLREVVPFPPEFPTPAAWRNRRARYPRTTPIVE